MQHKIRKWNRWLLPAVLILFMMELVMLPWVVGFTWADRSDSPSHTLTYTENKLTWDSATGIRPDGSAQLNLFSNRYELGVEAADGEKVFAPGTENTMFIRLKNKVGGSITYTAVLYAVKEDERIPVRAVLSGTGFGDTQDYALPQGVTRDQVLRAVTGTVAAGRIQDFDIGWQWLFEDGRDDVDTLLGNMDPLPDMSVGLYLVVEDGNSQVKPDIPQTGDVRSVGLYLFLMAFSFALVLLLLWDRRREDRREAP